MSFVPAALGPRLEAYFRLLATWNEKINLTGLDLRQPTSETLDRLLIEPVVAASHAQPGVRAIIDIGSGGGSPGIPFALAAGANCLRLVESRVRKSVFLREALRAVEIPHSEVITSRFEELISRSDLHEAHQILTIRAVRVETSVLATIQSFVSPGGQLLLFRGADAESEQALPNSLSRVATHPLVDSLKSHVVVLAKSATKITSAVVPRGTRNS